MHTHTLTYRGSWKNKILLNWHPPPFWWSPNHRPWALSSFKRFSILLRWPRAVMPKSVLSSSWSKVNMHSPSMALYLKISMYWPKSCSSSHWHTSSTVQLVRLAGFSLDSDAVGPIAEVTVSVAMGPIAGVTAGWWKNVQWKSPMKGVSLT